MKMVFTNDNPLIVRNAKNILESYGVELFVKNEHTASAIGEVSPFDAWLELWVIDDADYERARRVLADNLSESDALPWCCPACGEQNDASFELCWNCRREQPTG